MDRYRGVAPGVAMAAFIGGTDRTDQVRSGFCRCKWRRTLQKMEIETFLREFIRRGCPVIPVLLSNAKTEPILPIFLSCMTWVDFRRKDPDPIGHLIWGITGKRSDFNQDQ